jgi:hypothetical protein
VLRGPEQSNERWRITNSTATGVVATTASNKCSVATSRIHTADRAGTNSAVDSGTADAARAADFANATYDYSTVESNSAFGAHASVQSISHTTGATCANAHAGAIFPLVARGWACRSFILDQDAPLVVPLHLLLFPILTSKRFLVFVSGTRSVEPHISADFSLFSAIRCRFLQTLAICGRPGVSMKNRISSMKPTFLRHIQEKQIESWSWIQRPN